MTQHLDTLQNDHCLRAAKRVAEDHFPQMGLCKIALRFISIVGKANAFADFVGADALDRNAGHRPDPTRKEIDLNLFAKELMNDAWTHTLGDDRVEHHAASDPRFANALEERALQFISDQNMSEVFVCSLVYVSSMRTA